MLKLMSFITFLAVSSASAAEIGSLEYENAPSKERLCFVEFKADKYPNEQLSKCKEGDWLYVRGNIRTKTKTMATVTAENCIMNSLTYISHGAPLVAHCIYRGSKRETVGKAN